MYSKEYCGGKKTNKQNKMSLSTVNLNKQSCFMLGIQTERMSDRQLKLATNVALLCFALLWLLEEEMVERINLASATDLTCSID